LFGKFEICKLSLFTFCFKVLFVQEDVQHLEALKDIRHMMKRSSKFLSLSGLSGIVAGVWALIGAHIAHLWIKDYYSLYNQSGHANDAFHRFKSSLLILSAGELAAAFVSAFYFT